LRLFIRAPGQAEELLAEKEFEWGPFAVESVAVDYSPQTQGTYRIRALLDLISGIDPDPENNTREWVLANEAPIAYGARMGVNTEASTTLTLQGRDPDDDPLSYTLLMPPAYGTLTGTPPNMAYTAGTFQGIDRFTFLVDDGQLDSEPATVELLVQGGQPLSPAVDIRANGHQGPLIVSEGTAISVSVGMDPGPYASQEADWWAVVNTPFTAPANWFSYIFPAGWTQGILRTALAPLFPISSFEVYHSTLPVGDYRFYFAVDPPDGKVTADLMDFIDVRVD
jgi:hypothetical protein